MPVGEARISFENIRTLIQSDYRHVTKIRKDKYIVAEYCLLN